ncbi:MAG: hypothetical protein ACWA5R_07795, partial [bacterium]
ASSALAVTADKANKRKNNSISAHYRRVGAACETDHVLRILNALVMVEQNLSFLYRRKEAGASWLHSQTGEAVKVFMETNKNG